MADEWTRHTLPVNRRDRPDPVEVESPERGRFSGRRFVLMMVVLMPIVLALFVGLIIAIGSIR